MIVLHISYLMLICFFILKYFTVNPDEVVDILRELIKIRKLYNVVCKKITKNEVNEILLADFQIYQEENLSTFLKSMSEMVVILFITI